METNLQYEDLLIKLRAKLNEEKIKLWEPPYFQKEEGVPQCLQDLAKKYATEFNMDTESILNALHELQLHSVQRLKANAEYKETGLATFRVKATMQGQKPVLMNVQKRLNDVTSELVTAIAMNINMPDNRLKLIVNGKVLKPSLTIGEQGVKNGAQIMAVVMAVSPEEMGKEDSRYRELKSTLDDATLLSEYGGDLVGGDDYMKLEDQNGATVELPAAERRALMVGLALHERGRVAIKHKDYALALVLLLEADRQLSDCRSSLLQTVDNWAVMQLDVCWCYERLRAVGSAADAAERLQRASASFTKTYGDNHHRLIALKGSADNERVLFMRLYLLQGIVAYHQNSRDEAKRLFDKAEYEMNFLRVDDNAVTALMELGWSRGQARTGLRATGGDVDRAHHHLDHQRAVRRQERDRHRLERSSSAIPRRVVAALVKAGHPAGRVRAALRAARGALPAAVKLLTAQQHWDHSSSDSGDSDVSDDDEVEPDNKLVAGLEAMGYLTEEAKTALKLAQNNVTDAVEILVAAGGHLMHVPDPANFTDPSTSTGEPSERKLNRQKRRKERELALERLSSTIRTEEDDYLDTSLVDEEECLAQYKSLL